MYLQYEWYIQDTAGIGMVARRRRKILLFGTPKRAISHAGKRIWGPPNPKIFRLRRAKSLIIISRSQNPLLL